MKNPQHLDKGKHPFTGGGGTSHTPKVASSKAAHPSAKGSVGKFGCANAAMKGKK